MKVHNSIDLSAVIPVGNFESDFENIVRILEEAQKFGIQIIIVLDTQTVQDRELLNKTINDNNWQDIIVSSGDWGNPGSARNHGLTLSSRTFIAFWDSDDKPDFQEVEEFLHELRGKRFDAGIGRFRVSKNNSSQLEIGVNNQIRLDNFTERIVSNPGIWRFVFRRNFLEKVSFPDFSSAEDQLFLQRFFALDPRILVSNRVVYTYFQGGDNQLTKSPKVSEQTRLVAKIGISELSKSKVKNQTLIDTLILKQIVTVAKNGSRKDKLLSIYLGMQFHRATSPSRFFAAHKIFAKAKFRSYIHQRTRVNIILMGGLGNQLFQLAFGYHLGETTGKAVFFEDSNKSIRRSKDGIPEIMLYKEVPDRDVNNFPLLSTIVARGLGLLMRMKLQPTKIGNLVFPIPNGIINVINSLRHHQPMLTFVAEDIGFTNFKPRGVSQTVIGYFQSYKYLAHPPVLRLLKNLTPKSPETEVSAYGELHSIESPLLVHIRLGDYRKEPSFGLLPPSYYHAAIEKQMKNGLYKKIWVFSDEIDEYENYIPKQYMKDVRLIGSVGSNSVSLLEVMRMCKGYVLANSTLSWWAASLSYTDNPVVMYPDPWFEGIRTPTELNGPDWEAVPRYTC